MEDKIGEIVTLLPYDTKARVVEVQSDSCEGCYYKGHENLCKEYQENGVLGDCYYISRKDHKNIIYKPLSAEEEEE